MYTTSKKIGKVEIKNRFVRSATAENMATEEGHVTKNHVEAYKTLARGGVGLIITGHAYVHPTGQAGEDQTAVHKDEFIPGLKKIADIIHDHGEECKVALQISHCGRQSKFQKTNLLHKNYIKRKLINHERRIKEIFN